MRDLYAAAVREIGVSGPADDILSPLIANLDRSALLPPLHLDSNAENLLKRYQARKASFLDGGFYLGQSLLAMLSQPLDSREANSYRDMDFWGDVGRSVYRPRYTLEKLRGAPNFVHLGGRLALRFEELGGGVQLSEPESGHKFARIPHRAKSDSRRRGDQQRKVGTGVAWSLRCAPSHTMQCEPLDCRDQLADAGQAGAGCEAQPLSTHRFVESGATGSRVYFGAVLFLPVVVIVANVEEHPVSAIAQAVVPPPHSYSVHLRQRALSGLAQQPPLDVPQPRWIDTGGVRVGS